MVPNLIHKRSGSEFVFDFHEEDGIHYAEWSPDRETPRARDRAGEGWACILFLIGLWLENVRRELTTPDLWVLLDQQREELAASVPTGGTDNTPFSPEEQAQISRQLSQIKELLVANHGADPAALETGIDYLIDASSRMGRKDWLNIFVGTIFGWFLTGLVSPEGLRVALKLSGQGLGHLFGGLPQLPMA